MNLTMNSRTTNITYSLLCLMALMTKLTLAVEYYIAVEFYASSTSCDDKARKDLSWIAKTCSNQYVAQGVGNGNWKSIHEDRRLEEEEVEEGELDIAVKLPNGQFERKLECNCSILCVTGATNFCECCACCGTGRRLRAQNVRELNAMVNNMKACAEDKLDDKGITCVLSHVEVYAAETPPV